MKHIKLFNTDAQYQEFASDIEQPVPNVSYVTETDEVHYNESVLIQKLAVHTLNDNTYVIGYINENNEYVMYIFDEDTFPIIGSNGTLVEMGDSPDGYIRFVLKPILQESSYGISTVITKIIPAMQMGDTIQDWNAYEKIEMPFANPHFKIRIFEGVEPEVLYVIGEYRENGEYSSFSIYCNRDVNNSFYIVDENGMIVRNQNGLTEYLSQTLLPYVRNVDEYNISSVNNLYVNYNVGDRVERWNQYILV